MSQTVPTFNIASFDSHYLRNDPADTSVTAASVEQAEQAAARLLPAGWFTSTLCVTVMKGRHFDHLTFTQIGGVPVGNYSIHRETSQQFSLFCLGEDADGEMACRILGLFETMEGAVMAIRHDLQWTAAELQERADCWMAEPAD